MSTYEMYGIKAVLMKVEADNLEEAINKCHNEYDIDCVDETTSILIDNKLLEDENGDIILSEINPCDYRRY